VHSRFGGAHRRSLAENRYRVWSCAAIVRICPCLCADMQEPVPVPVNEVAHGLREPLANPSVPPVQASQ